MRKLHLSVLTFGILIAMVTDAAAIVITLDFEGIGSMANIEEFYNGGTDSEGNSGVNHGISFGSNTLGLKESDPMANFSGEPSEETIMFFLTGTAILNYSQGFDTGFSFYYTTVSFSGQVSVYDDLNAAGNLLGNINLGALGVGPDAANPFSNWEIGSLAFAGTAKSIDFGGTVNQVGYDNITFGSTNPDIPVDPTPTPGPVPEPATFLLFGSGLVGLVLYRRKRLK